MYVLDSSAIALIIKRLREGCIEVLERNITLDLAYYELGNIIWKECVLKRSLGFDEAVMKAEQMAKILSIMNVESIRTDEDYRGVTELAIKLRLTFYDASYLQLARSKKTALVTEDDELYEKAQHVNVKVMKVNDLLSTM